jgi:opacity protein-like surface antigen
MKTCLIAVVTTIIFSIPSLSAAAAGRPGPYFSGFLGSSFARDTTVSGFDNTALPGTSYSDRVTFDPGIYVGGTGGFDFGFLRLEGELSYRHANMNTITETTPSTGPFLNVDGNQGVFATMFNVFFDLHNPSPVTPYVGGGIGLATIHISDTTALGNTLLYEDSNDTVFASQVGAGMDIAMNRHFSLDLGYRYFMTEKAHLRGSAISSDLRFESHNALVGFKMKF